MKKIMSLLLSAALLISLVGCGKESPGTNTKNNTSTTEAKSDVKAKDVSEEAEETDTNKKASVGMNTATDWQKMTLAFDGDLYTIPFDYSKIEKEWTFNLADYGHEDGYVMNKGDKVSSTIDLKSDKYDAKIDAGFENTTDGAKDIKKCQIWSMGMDITYADSYPEIELPAGITWGSTKDDIVAAYGEPDEEPYRAEDLGYWAYTYYRDYTHKLKLTIYDDKGLVNFSYQIYN